MPADVRERAREAFDRWRENPNHPSLDFKPLGSANPRAYSVRISRQYLSYPTHAPLLSHEQVVEPCGAMANPDMWPIVLHPSVSFGTASNYRHGNVVVGQRSLPA